MDVHNLQKNRAAAALMVLLWPTAALAQAVLPDPTRPPPGFVDELPAAGAGGLSELSPEAAARAAKEAADAPASGLQSVLIPRQGKPVAIIDGKYVPLGERHGEWELVVVAESEVVLAKGKERKVLRLTPAAEKKQARAGSGAESKAQSRPARPEKSRKESETGR